MIEIVLTLLLLISLLKLYQVCNKKPKIIMSLEFNSIKITGENLMNTKFQVDQRAVWGMQFLNDNGKPVSVPLFEAVSNVPELAAEVILPEDPIDPNDPANWTYKVKVTATAEVSGMISATGTTASGTALQANLGVTTIPDEAESISETIVIEEND